MGGDELRWVIYYGWCMSLGASAAVTCSFALYLPTHMMRLPLREFKAEGSPGLPERFHWPTVWLNSGLWLMQWWI
eukprot:5008049-Amphidinium_carterae.1